MYSSAFLQFIGLVTCLQHQGIWLKCVCKCQWCGNYRHVTELCQTLFSVTVLPPLRDMILQLMVTVVCISLVVQSTNS